MTNKTAILIFANSAEHEATQKPFKASEELFEALNLQTIETVKKVGLPYFVVSEKEQKGNNFAERFTNAIESVLDKGFDSIITVGNDSPHLTTAHLKKTIAELAGKDIILGPSKDGGFYLMGIQKEHFNKHTFLKLPWQSERLFASITRLIKSSKLEVSYLNALQDIDSGVDVNLVLQADLFLDFRLKQILKNYIRLSNLLIQDIGFNVQNVFIPNQFNKGSPVFSSAI